MIEHPACLTTEEMAQEQGAANNREPKMYSKIVTDYIECSKFGGYFWEYIFFENEKQVESFRPFLNYLRNLIIDDAYEDRDSEDIMKPPYYFVDYNDKYGKYKFENERERYTSTLMIIIDYILIKVIPDKILLSILIIFSI